MLTDKEGEEDQTAEEDEDDEVKRRPPLRLVVDFRAKARPGLRVVVVVTPPRAAVNIDVPAATRAKQKASQTTRRTKLWPSSVITFGAQAEAAQLGRGGFKLKFPGFDGV